jgi:mono/diheme cytochrome c family protein
MPPRFARRCLVFSLLLLIPAISDSQSVAGSKFTVTSGTSKISLRVGRSSPLDLEISGGLAGLPPGSVRYLTRQDLLELPQVNFTVTDDPNFDSRAKIRGVELQVLAKELATDGDSALVVAVCDDLYRAYYPQAYIQAHVPVLAVEINGQAPSSWPKNKEGSGADMGPYLITHSHFTPSFKILAHEDEAQIPWGVVRLEFQNEKVAFDAIAPRGAQAGDPAVQAGFHIAQQNCVRCHGPESKERQKGILSWSGIALFAAQAPQDFSAYARNPQARSPSAQMPGNPGYDDATLQALVSYFQTFAAQEKR